MAEQYSTEYLYTIASLFNHILIGIWLVLWFCLLTVENNAAMSTEVRISSGIQVFSFILETKVLCLTDKDFLLKF